MKIKHLIQATCIVCAAGSGPGWSTEQLKLVEYIYKRKEGNKIRSAFAGAAPLAKEIIALSVDRDKDERKQRIQERRLNQLGDYIQLINKKEEMRNKPEETCKDLRDNYLDYKVWSIVELYNYLIEKQEGKKATQVKCKYIWKCVNEGERARKLGDLVWDQLVEGDKKNLTKHDIQVLLNEEEVIVNWSPEDHSEEIKQPQNYVVNHNLGYLTKDELKEIEESNLRRLGEALEAAYRTRTAVQEGKQKIS